MICVLNRKLLAVESDMQQVGLVKDKLQQAGIPYSIEVLNKRNGFGRVIDSNMACSVAMRFDQFHTTTFTYRIFVHRKNFTNAQKIVYGGIRRAADAR